MYDISVFASAQHSILITLVIIIIITIIVHESE